LKEFIRVLRFRRPTLKNKMKKWLKWLLIIVGILIVLLIVLYAFQKQFVRFSDAPLTKITNFEDCIAAGNPAMESYPRQCHDPISDKTFTEVIEEDNFEVCDCSANLYNCGDFENQNAAQECFDFCMTDRGREIHGLDNDGDGVVCEGLN